MWPFPSPACTRLNPVSRQNVSQVANACGTYSSGISPGDLNKLLCKLLCSGEKETTVMGIPLLPSGQC